MRTLIFVVLAAATFQVFAQQGEAERKRFEEIKAKAEKGDAEAQYNLGLCYHKASLSNWPQLLRSVMLDQAMDFD